MSSLGYSACAKTVDISKKIQKEHLAKINNYFLEHNNFYVYNIDDYHSIHENRRPDTVSTSTASHFATCVAKPIIECPSVPLVFNGISIHNSANVEAPRICWYLLNQYARIFDLSYSDYQQSQGRIVSNNFDPIELLTIHSYADNIEKRREKERCEFTAPPTAYSTTHPPRPGLCDSCGRSLVDNNGIVFVCGHGYHNDCYGGKCKHCVEFYKKGIFKNVQKFLTRIKKGADTLTKEDLDDNDGK
ncbi:hypothetical protein C2G38_2162653 [Gigaspora rosea]|uniref:Uncharacterized protein n=1 Tax=Gigaspora rosea TaxID=44941 RepID=A0A397VXM8_9GLOM|nr:hypothetical protein C2G38_2162653 [Gigaspora rosea]